jgi:hypothetical protein
MHCIDVNTFMYTRAVVLPWRKGHITSELKLTEST